MVILTYVYYRWELTNPMGIIGMNPDRYMRNLRELVNHGYFEYVTYAGVLNCTCGGSDKFGEHYGFIIQADKETTKEILETIEFDICESFKEESMEKLDKDLETMDEHFWEEVANRF